MNQDSDKFVIQDGVKCPRVSPWPPSGRNNLIMAVFLIPILGTAVYVLAKTSPLMLAVWLLALLLFAWPLRYLICARCPYYGQHCSTNMGKIVPLMFKKQEGKSMKLGLWLDVVSFFFLFLLPAPAAYRVGGMTLALVWAGAFLLLFILISTLACAYCPLTFCPIGRGGRVFRKIFKK
ncbi:MAG: hypothetical protein PHE84_15885 [bacterium]|nr:hypothetical protein [bacterium]